MRYLCDGEATARAVGSAFENGQTSREAGGSKGPTLLDIALACTDACTSESTRAGTHGASIADDSAFRRLARGMNELASDKTDCKDVSIDTGH